MEDRDFPEDEDYNFPFFLPCTLAFVFVGLFLFALSKDKADWQSMVLGVLAIFFILLTVILHWLNKLQHQNRKLILIFFSLVDVTEMPK